ncbi:hypothetical protein PACTADRAFT_51670 [Pachysolen tannophilus NRRL Y-2460]|uniref:Bud22 domain-containing protein n=1 Tax=Pachysolen tannophilus NRRL Y-2460 TaxID=669874 RepID=A0A1E4TQ91_PACTA|nr:hypothetical protein PACTADRAFT_51670 [Pachysolen tannophilus NRRL Y-2460]
MSSKKDNILWKLDLLEVNFLQAKPRLLRTKTLLNSKKRNHIKLLTLSKEDALRLIDDLKLQLTERKFHGALIKLERCIGKIVKSEINKLTLKLKNSNMKNRDAMVKELELYQNKLDLDIITHSKLIKISLPIFFKQKKVDFEKEQIPRYLPNWYITSVKDVNHKYNPKCQFKTNPPELNNLISKIMNHKEIKELNSLIELSLKIILGPVPKDKKGNDVSSAELEKYEDQDNQENDFDDDEEQDDSDDEDDDDEEESMASGAEDGNPEEDIDLEAYDGMLVATSDEEDVTDFKPDNNINYNEVTDEEPDDLEDDLNYVDISQDESGNENSNSIKDISNKDDYYDKIKQEKKKLENDDFFKFDQEDKETTTSSTSKKEKKLKLPALASGYYSGAESDASDIDNDHVVKSVTETRKNRRGQRARRKIWEQKYGKNAKHIQKEIEKTQSEREIRQKEYEERCRKREEKRKKLIEEGGTGANQVPVSKIRLNVNDKRNSTSIVASRTVNTEDKESKSLHPSWEAKKKQQQELSQVKFQGKKITFD